ncbi:MAG: dockerin type I repeat-containing protein [candidate division Zixibacteria bacterium]
MNKRYGAFVVAVFFVLSLLYAGTGQEAGADTKDQETQSACIWNVGDDHKMHHPQLPNDTGWAVNATIPAIVADDFLCTESGQILDFHFWGAWRQGVEGIVDSFTLSLHSDIPADPPLLPYSRPGQTLWEYTAKNYTAIPIDPPSSEGWYDPINGEVIFDDHVPFFQYNICLDPSDPGVVIPTQEAGRIYWLNISAHVADTDTKWGWKSTQDHWNDDCVWAVWGDLTWHEILEPYESITNNYWLTLFPGPPGANFGGGGGGGDTDPYHDPASGGPWYYYPETNWWNIWFYDHLFDDERFKVIHIEIDIDKYDRNPQILSFITLAVNWSTDLWSIEGNPPGQPRVPPLPGVNEQAYIGRDTLLNIEIMGPGHYIFDYVIYDYNPEWVSIDVQGENFIILESSFIEHACVMSMDQAFVITNQGDTPTQEACCWSDGTCSMEDPVLCASQGGSPQGRGTTCTGLAACCLPDGRCVTIDPLCCVDQGGTVQAGATCSTPEACCFADGTCKMLDPLCCMDQGGSPQGPGSQCSAIQACCLPDNSCMMLDPLCCMNLGGTPQGAGSQCSAPQACCLASGACLDIDPLCCIAISGDPQGAGIVCDADGDGVDEACDEPEPDTCEYYKPPYEDYAPAGVPDFDQKRPNWADNSGILTYCGPVALANCMWWFDSKFETCTTPPPTICDNYPLVTAYNSSWDDHDAQNVPPLVDSLAIYCNTNPGGMGGTNINDMYDGAKQWLIKAGLQDHYTVTLVPIVQPGSNGFEYIREQVLISQNVILLLGFWQEVTPGYCEWIGGHFVTVAGTCTDLVDSALCISDPYYDVNGGGPPAPHGAAVHDDAQFVSGPHGSMHHDRYQVVPAFCNVNSPPFFDCELVNYPVSTGNAGIFYGQNSHDPSIDPITPQPGITVHTIIEYALVICPVEEVDEACCLEDGSCTDMLPSDCIAQGGVPQGPGTVCTAPEACCFDDGSCITMDPLCCIVSSGNPQGPGTQCDATGATQACCLPDGNCVMLDPVCCLAASGTPQGIGTSCSNTMACCLPDNTCIQVDPLCCDDMGGTLSPWGSEFCGEDADANGIDDACETPQNDEACCLPDGSCVMLLPSECIAQSGSPQGTGTSCSVNTIACCLPDNTCVTVDPLCCDDMGGTPSPWGAATCQGDDNQNGTDDACETSQQHMGACCLPDNTCVDHITPSDCNAQLGIYMGDGTFCLGDNNNDGTDDLCEDPWDPDTGSDIKMLNPQFPDETGWDVNASWPMTLADDWRCIESGAVKDLHFWGSWLDGNEGKIIAFIFSIHADVPAGAGQLPYSHPGDLLWEYRTNLFKATKIMAATEEGYYDPLSGLILPLNHQEYFQYDVNIPEDLWFMQEEGMIYWLNISAILDDESTEFTQWGWKSSKNHWNDDAVWGLDEEPPCLTPTTELPTLCPYEPPNDEPLRITEGLPPESSLEGTFWIDSFFDVFTELGGSLGGEIITCQANLNWHCVGTGALGGFERMILIPIHLEIHTGPRVPPAPVNGVPTEIVEMSLVSMSGETTDADFCPLRIVAGVAETGIPSPGMTTLTPSEGGQWNVDSFFDITYQIEFTGCPGSRIGDLSGTTLGEIPWGEGNSDVPGWTDLFEPPNFEQSLDLAFIITGGGVCDCIVGDANGDGSVNVGDAVYIIAHVFKGGPPATPYRICSGDANCDCQTNVGDAVYLISHVFKGGPPPCDCLTWLSLCGSPLRK